MKEREKKEENDFEKSERLKVLSKRLRMYLELYNQKNRRRVAGVPSHKHVHSD